MRYFRCSVGKHKRKAIQCSSCCLWGYNDHISPLQDKESFFYGVVVAYMGSLNIEQRTIFSLLWCCNSFFNKHDFILQYMNNTDHWYIHIPLIYTPINQPNLGIITLNDIWIHDANIMKICDTEWPSKHVSWNVKHKKEYDDTAIIAQSSLKCNT